MTSNVSYAVPTLVGATMALPTNDVEIGAITAAINAVLTLIYLFLAKQKKTKES